MNCRQTLGLRIDGDNPALTSLEDVPSPGDLVDVAALSRLPMMPFDETPTGECPCHSPRLLVTNNRDERLHRLQQGAVRSYRCLLGCTSGAWRQPAGVRLDVLVECITSAQTSSSIIIIPLSR